MLWEIYCSVYFLCDLLRWTSFHSSIACDKEQHILFQFPQLLITREDIYFHLSQIDKNKIAQTRERKAARLIKLFLTALDLFAFCVIRFCFMWFLSNKNIKSCSVSEALISCVPSKNFKLSDNHKVGSTSSSMFPIIFLFLMTLNRRHRQEF